MSSESGYLLFFSNGFGHRKVVDRVEGAVAAGFEVVLICYDRFDFGDYRQQLSALCAEVFLVSSPESGGRLSRLLLWFFIFYHGLKVLLGRGRPSVVCVNTAELLVFSSLFMWFARRRIYDLADLHHVQYGKGFKSKAFRFLERISLKRGWDVVVSSPWFYWDYFVGMLGASSRAVLVENKLFPGEMDSFRRVISDQRSLDGILTIAWVGMVRCDKSMHLLVDICEASKGRVRLKVVGTYENIAPEAIERARSCGFVDFAGRYHPDQLGELLSGVSFMWLCDFCDGLNSRSLLPNRLYQAVAAHIPCLAYADSAVGNVVEHKKFGLVFNSIDANDVLSVINSCEMERYHRFVSAEMKEFERVARGREFEAVFDGSLFVDRSLPREVSPQVVLG